MIAATLCRVSDDMGDEIVIHFVATLGYGVGDGDSGLDKGSYGKA